MTDDISFLPVRHALPSHRHVFLSSWPFSLSLSVFYKTLQFSFAVRFGPWDIKSFILLLKTSPFLVKQTSLQQMAKADTAINLDF